MNGHLKEKMNVSRVVSSTANLRRKSQWLRLQLNIAVAIIATTAKR